MSYIRFVSIEELTSRWWIVDLPWGDCANVTEYREKLEGLDWTELLEHIGVDLIDCESEPMIEVSDYDYDATIYRFRVFFSKEAL